MSGEEDENISLDDAELKEMQAKGRAYATAGQVHRRKPNLGRDDDFYYKPPYGDWSRPEPDRGCWECVQEFWGCFVGLPLLFGIMGLCVYVLIFEEDETQLVNQL
jgi:hypothetical protein